MGEWGEVEDILGKGMGRKDIRGVVEQWMD